MQLGTSVFAVAVIELKPQLERVLNLPAGALTKEIKLTEDLLDLFIKYQIPADLLSFDASCEGREGGGVEAPSLRVRVDAVRENVKKIVDMVHSVAGAQVAAQVATRVSGVLHGADWGGGRGAPPGVPVIGGGGECGSAGGFGAVWGGGRGGHDSVGAAKPMVQACVMERSAAAQEPGCYEGVCCYAGAISCRVCICFEAGAAA